jgi:hypothetical protein
MSVYDELRDALERAIDAESEVNRLFNLRRESMGHMPKVDVENFLKSYADEEHDPAFSLGTTNDKLVALISEFVVINEERLNDFWVAFKGLGLRITEQET